MLVCGGDGTVREVCAELAGTGIPVGIVPAGTGNLLARNLDIPLYLRAAIDVALNGQDRAIDLVAVSGDGIEDTHFLVMAGMGFDAAIMEGVNEDIKKKVGWLAYVLSALQVADVPGRAAWRSPSTAASSPGTGPARSWSATSATSRPACRCCPTPRSTTGCSTSCCCTRSGSCPGSRWPSGCCAKRPRTDETINRMTGATVVIRAARGHPPPARRRLHRPGPGARDGVPAWPAAGARAALTRGLDKLDHADRLDHRGLDHREGSTTEGHFRACAIASSSSGDSCCSHVHAATLLA